MSVFGGGGGGTSARRAGCGGGTTQSDNIAAMDRAAPRRAGPALGIECAIGWAVVQSVSHQLDRRPRLIEFLGIGDLRAIGGVDCNMLAFPVRQQFDVVRE